MTLFETGIRPKIDEYLDNKAKEKRDYGDYWSASSAGYCQRKNIFDRLKIPHTSDDPRKQRVFEVGHIFHEWMQRITRDANNILTLAQEIELQDEKLMIRGHVDDLLFITPAGASRDLNSNVILYDYKTQNSRAFTWQKDKPISYFHKMQLGTYMMMLRSGSGRERMLHHGDRIDKAIDNLTEGRILKISKDDLRMAEVVLYWDEKLESQIKTYWREQNEAWEKYKNSGQLPVCTCADHENGFMASEKYNPYFFNGQPCSIEWLRQNEKPVGSEQ